MRELKDLKAEDFSGVDEEKFRERKSRVLLQMKQVNFSPIILLGTMAITVPVIGGAFGWGIPLAVVFYIYFFLFPKKSGIEKFRKEIGITPAAIKTALKK